MKDANEMRNLLLQNPEIQDTLKTIEQKMEDAVVSKQQGTINFSVKNRLTYSIINLLRLEYGYSATQFYSNDVGAEETMLRISCF